MLRVIYEFIDRVWGIISEHIFVRFEFALPVDRIQELHKNGRVVFALTQGGIIEWLILSSWSRRHGLGAILVTNRLRILLVSKPLYYFQILIRRRTFSDLFLSEEKGPRLLFCRFSERKRPFDPTSTEKLLAEVVTGIKERPEPLSFHIAPVLILWRRFVRGATRKPSEFVLGLSSKPNLIGKCWYLWRRRGDSTVRALEVFELHQPDVGSDPLEENEAVQIAKSARRKILVIINQEMRVVLGPTYHSPHSVKETLLRDPEIQELLTTIANTEKVDKRKLMMRAYQYLTEIVANYSFRTIELLYVFLTWFFNRVMDGFEVPESEIHRVRELMRSKPIVFVSAHRSHLDYLVIPYALFSHDVVTPHIAAGINMSFWPVGPLVRSGGAFFIRRSFRGDKIYSLCLRKYIEYLLNHRYNIKFFIEGTRSRSGKMLPPAYGLLKMVLETYQRKTVDDIALVPVSITYDEVPEERSYTRELEGGQKVKESAGQLIRSRRMIRRNIGKVYVHFAEPVSVKDLFQRAGESRIDSDLLLQKTAFEICKDINDVTTITSRSIIASVMLAHVESALSLENILSITRSLAEYASTTGIPLSFSLQEGFARSMENVVRKLLKNGILGVNEDSVPRLYYCEEKRRSNLSLYKNNAVHCFVTPSIALLALIATLERCKKRTDKVQLHEEFSKQALEIRNLLKFEFFFDPSEKFLEQLRATLDFLIGAVDLNAITAMEVIKRLKMRFPNWNDISVFLRLLGDLVESYSTVLSFLREQHPSSSELKTLVQQIVRYGTHKEANGEIAFAESISAQNYSNALLMLENAKCVHIRPADGKKIIEIGGWDPTWDQISSFLFGTLSLMEKDPTDFLK